MKIQISENESIKEVDIYSAEGLKILSELWLKVSCHNRVMYEPTWLGIPIIQYPGDIVMMQELIWKIRPDYIIETGIAHGGSAILYASILELIGKGKIVAVDIEIRKYNKVAILSHPLSKRIELIEGSSVDPDTFQEIKGKIDTSKKILVVLDSNHSYEHVQKEIELYSTIVSKDSYLVVMDGAQGQVWDIPNGKKEWIEDNPLRAINEFVNDNSEWVVDDYYTRLHITSNPNGYLKKIK